MSMRFGSITKGIIEWNLDMQNGQNKKCEKNKKSA